MESIYNTKFIQSGNRLEVYKYRGYIKKGRNSNNKTGRRGKRELSEEEKENNKKVSRSRILTNAKNNIVRIVNCNPDLVSFITLTYRNEMKDLKTSKKHLTKFFSKLREDFEDLKYITVLEFQEQRGNVIHYHILTNFPVPIKSNKRKSEKQKEFEREFSKKYWKHGFVDCRNLKSEENTNIARYLSAYLTEEQYDVDLQGHRIFTCSRNIERPIITTTEMKCPIENIAEVDEYNLAFQSSYNIQYRDKTGKERKSHVNYFDFYLK